MIRPIVFLILLLLLILGLPILWYRAEKKGSLRKPGLTGILVLLLSMLLTSLFAAVFTELDDQSYYSASVRILLDETLEALDAGEPGFADRLRAFRASQPLTYETRGDLLENARRFAQEGTALRSRMNEEKNKAPAPNLPP